jgi:hypothetical protein
MLERSGLFAHTKNPNQNQPLYYQIAEIQARGRVPVVVGGTNFYIESLLFEGGGGSSDEHDPESPPAETLPAAAPALGAAEAYTLLQQCVGGTGRSWGSHSAMLPHGRRPSPTPR